MDDEESMLAGMLAEEGMVPMSMGDESMDHSMADPTDHSMAMADPMGEVDVVEDEMMILAKLFTDKSAADEKEEEAEEKAAETIQEEVEHKAEKKASLRPQPKKASAGADRLGGISKEAATEISDLSGLWESAPDVSKFF